MEGDGVKKTLVLNIVICILIAVLLVLVNYDVYDVFLSRVSINNSKVIMIDPGHGGIDGGAVGSNGTIEKNINLSISKKLKGYLEEQGYTCIMVRETDEGLYGPYGTIRNKKNEDLRRRKELIKEYGCDIFISIHLNKFTEAQYSGAQVFYLKGDEASHKLARSLQNELKTEINKANNRVEKASNEYYLFRGNTIPSVIVECGFLSNLDEERLLQNETYQNKLAFAIYIGLVKYLNTPEAIK